MTLPETFGGSSCQSGKLDVFFLKKKTDLDLPRGGRMDDVRGAYTKHHPLRKKNELEDAGNRLPGNSGNWLS